MNNIKPKYPIKVILTTSNILDYFIKKGSTVTITELSEKLNIYPSTVHRILDTLSYLNYIDKCPDSDHYQLGIKSLELGMAKLSQINLVKETMPFLAEISMKYHENVYLGILFENTIFYLAKKEYPRKIQLMTHLGDRASFNCTALGKILIAFLPKDERKKIYLNVGFHKCTENSIVNEKKYEEEINKVKIQGFAMDNEEYEKDVTCIAAPVKNHYGQVVAAISISGPSYRFDAKKIEQIKFEIVNYAQKISVNLGYKEKNI